MYFCNDHIEKTHAAAGGEEEDEICVFVYFCISAFVYFCICVFLNLCISVFLNLCISAFVYICICVYLHLCISEIVYFCIVHERTHAEAGEEDRPTRKPGTVAAGDPDKSQKVPTTVLPPPPRSKSRRYFLSPRLGNSVTRKLVFRRACCCPSDIPC